MSILSALKESGVEFISGVPDSTLKDLLIEISQTTGMQHQAAACEGSAVSIAAGYSLITNNYSCVYMQNSGLTNALSPFLSMTANRIFNIPLIFVIGWRGEPGTVDEPQHCMVGEITLQILSWMNIKPLLYTKSTLDIEVKSYLNKKMSAGTNMAILVKKGTLNTKIKNQTEIQQKGGITAKEIPRKQSLLTILNSIPKGSLVFTGIGYTSREIMKLKEEGIGSDIRPFPCIGGMGFSSHFAIGSSIGNKEKKVYCIDGDGSFLMQGMGNTVVSNISVNLVHIVLNNRVHNSVGGFPTCSPNLCLSQIAKSLRYTKSVTVSELNELEIVLLEAAQTKGSYFIEILCGTQIMDDLPRPKESLSIIKEKFISSSELC